MEYVRGREDRRSSSLPEKWARNICVRAYGQAPHAAREYTHARRASARMSLTACAAAKLSIDGDSENDAHTRRQAGSRAGAR